MDRRVARLSRNVGQPDHILANPIMSRKAEPWPGSGEIWLAMTEHDVVQVDSILIDQAKCVRLCAKFGPATSISPSRSAFGSRIASSRSSSTSLALRPTDFNERETTHFGWFRHAAAKAFLCIPFRMFVVPVTHDVIHLATVHTARLPLGLLDDVVEERETWCKRHMIDVAVQGLVHSEHERSHAHCLSLHGASVRFWPLWLFGSCRKALTSC
jgi:hypothetical protein